MSEGRGRKPRPFSFPDSRRSRVRLASGVEASMRDIINFFAWVLIVAVLAFALLVVYEAGERHRQRLVVDASGVRVEQVPDWGAAVEGALKRVGIQPPVE